MKYQSLFVPVVAFAALASALPQDASTNAYPSDQGKYKPHHKSQTPAPASEGPLGKLPVNGIPNAQAVEGNLPPQFKTAEGELKGLPVEKNLSGTQLTTVEGDLPKMPSAGSLSKEAGQLSKKPSIDSVEDEAGLLPKLPIDLPVKAPRMRRSRTHATRAAKNEIACGRILVEASDNRYSGFVSGDRDSNGRYTVVHDRSKGTLVDYKNHDLIFRTVDMYPALGATYGVQHDNNVSNDNMQGNSANFAMLTGTDQTPFGKSDMNARSSFNDATEASQKVESAIYYFGENNELHANWINKDGQYIPIVFGVNPDHQIILSANMGQYAATYGGYSAKLFCAGDK